jgi:hypothetical protein
VALREARVVQRLSLATCGDAGVTRTMHLNAKPTGKRSAGNPHAAFDAAGTGNVAGSRYCDTRQSERDEKLGTQTSTYTNASVLDPTSLEFLSRSEGERQVLQ